MLRKNLPNGLVVATNIAFFVPAYLATERSLWLATTIYVLLAVFSSIYHATDNPRWRPFDLLFAYGAMGWNAWACLHSLLHNGHSEWAVQGILLAAAALWTYFRARFSQYALWHSIWHCLSGAAGACFVLAY